MGLIRDIIRASSLALQMDYFFRIRASSRNLFSFGKAMKIEIPSLQQYKSAMVLSAVGDAIGYNRGSWEFSHSGEDIHRELQKLGGLTKLDVKGWIVSDDTVLHIATAEALVSDWSTKEELYQTVASKYKAAMHDMAGRAPGLCTQGSCSQLRPGRQSGYFIPFNPRGGGCGAAMRAMCIGLMFNKPEQIDDLIAISIETGRMTHNHPTGYLGSLVSALFMSYAIQGKPMKEWGAGLMATLQPALNYIRKAGRDVHENEQEWPYFTNAWTSYLTTRGILHGSSEPVFPTDYSVKVRDKFYKSVSYSGWGGSSGHDAPMIAYDALLGAGSSWDELCGRGVLHGGDSDSTGVVAAAWWGAIYGMDKVPRCNYYNLEYRDRIEKLAEQLFAKAQIKGAS